MNIVEPEVQPDKSAGKPFNNRQGRAKDADFAEAGKKFKLAWAISFAFLCLSLAGYVLAFCIGEKLWNFEVDKLLGIRALGAESALALFVLFMLNVQPYALTRFLAFAFAGAFVYYAYCFQNCALYAPLAFAWLLVGLLAISFPPRATFILGTVAAILSVCANLNLAG